MEEYAKSSRKLIKKHLLKFLFFAFLLGLDIYFQDYLYSNTLWITKKLQTKSYLKSSALFFNLIFAPINLLATLLLILTFRKNKVNDMSLICSTSLLIYLCSLLNMIFHKERPYWNKANEIEGLVCANEFGYPSEYIMTLFFVSYNILKPQLQPQKSTHRILKHIFIALLLLLNLTAIVSRLYVGADSLNQIISGYIFCLIFLYLNNNWLQSWLQQILEQFCNAVDSFYKNSLFWISVGVFAGLLVVPIAVYLSLHVFVMLPKQQQEIIQNSCQKTLILSSAPLDNGMMKTAIITSIFGCLMACFGSYTCNLTVIQRREDIKLKKKLMKSVVKCLIFLCLLGLFYIPFKFIVFDNIFELFLLKFALIIGIIVYVAIRVYPLLLIQFQIHDEEDLELFFGKTEGVMDLNQERNEEDNQQEQQGLTSKIVEYYALSDGN